MKIKFYYPNKDKQGNPIDQDKINEYKINLVKITGGASEFTCKGYYINEHGKLLIENTDILESFTQVENKDKILSLAHDFKLACNQESVMLELDQEALFI